MTYGHIYLLSLFSCNEIPLCLSALITARHLSLDLQPSNNHIVAHNNCTVRVSIALMNAGLLGEKARFQIFEKQLIEMPLLHLAIAMSKLNDMPSHYKNLVS